MAWLLDWETTDLDWSLWLCSLVLGYLTLLSALTGGAYIGLCLLRHEDFKRKTRWVFIVGGSAVLLFLFSVFSLHFCGFHAGHSAFLAYLFPIKGTKNHLTKR